MLRQARELDLKALFTFGDRACTGEMAQLAGPTAECMVCAQTGPHARPRARNSRRHSTRSSARSSITRRSTTMPPTRLIEAMKAADSVDPARFTPEIKVSFSGATGTLRFDDKGDRCDAEMTIFKMRGGRIKPVAMINNGQLKPLSY